MLKQIINENTDCSKCKGLCCHAYHFREGDTDVPGHKQGGEKCKYLTEDNKCRVENTLKLSFNTCIEFDCGGVGNELCKQYPDLRVNDLIYSFVTYNYKRYYLVTSGYGNELPGDPGVEMPLINGKIPTECDCQKNE